LSELYISIITGFFLLLSFSDDIPGILILLYISF
jgi:hypothetical protein